MTSVKIDTLILGPLATNCYVLTSGKDCWVVDPGISPQPLIDLLRARKLHPQRILLTHGHGDHIAGVDAVKQSWPDCRICCPKGDAEMLGNAWTNMSASFHLPITASAADELLSPGDELALGESNWTVLDTSGHTPGGVSYHCPQARTVITGDALFAGSIGRCDIPGANETKLLTNISRYLLVLEDDTAVLPGHGDASTIGLEKRSNPFLIQQ